MLDEIGEMPLSMQVKLLHVLQERQVLRVGGTVPIELDIRIIAATNRELKELVEQGQFREDLFYRLNVVNIRLPRLADRQDDIPLLVVHFIEKFTMAFNKKVLRVAPQVMELLLGYDYPGNVRELENIIQRAVALAEEEEIRIRDLPSRFQSMAKDRLGMEPLVSLETMEKQHIDKVLQATHANKSLASQILGIPRTTLWRRMHKFGLS